MYGVKNAEERRRDAQRPATSRQSRAFASGQLLRAQMSPPCPQSGAYRLPIALSQSSLRNGGPVAKSAKETKLSAKLPRWDRR